MTDPRTPVEHDAWTLILAARRLAAMSDRDLADVRADLEEAAKLLNRRLAAPTERAA